MAKDSVELTSVHYRMRMVTSVSLQCPVKSWQRLLWKVLKNSHQSQPSWLHEGEILLVKSNFLLLRVTLVLQILELRYKKKKTLFLHFSSFIRSSGHVSVSECMQGFTSPSLYHIFPHGIWDSGTVAFLFQEEKHRINVLYFIYFFFSCTVFLIILSIPSSFC